MNLRRRLPARLMAAMALAQPNITVASRAEDGHVILAPSVIPNRSRSAIDISCPASVPQAANADENQREWYDAISAEIAQNVTEFLDSFRDKEEYDNWGHSYEQVKAKYLDFKTRFFVPYLSSGMAIYESASGIGLNLLMTLEILAQHQLQELVVYGNEYVKDSVGVSKQILSSLTLPGNATLGEICQADSADLKHVPSDTFDLVYTGYITPMMNPLKLQVDRHGIHIAYTELCETDDEEDVGVVREREEMIQQAQTMQDSWYRAWVSEMVRIAKPGAPIIVEQVSYPKCQSIGDWGGVAPEFWYENIVRHGWDIDQESIVFEDENVFGNRYHVFMRKNSKSVNAD